jgi:nicotinate-nucleotide--dimethylbenzimidazole phosphoribosyltransferase
MHDIERRFDAILFDLGNTLVAQADPGTPVESLQAKFLPGVESMLSALRGRVPLGIVSNTTVITAAQIREKLGSTALAFDVIIATSELGVHKPHPEPVLAALRGLQVDPQRTLFVGDTSTDMLAAAAANVHFAFTGINLEETLMRYLDNPHSAFDRAMSGAFAYSPEHEQAAQVRFDQLAKPQGSLGRLETYVCRIAGMRASEVPVVDPAAIGVFIADHGIAADDTVTPWPQAVTAIMRDAILDGHAAVSVLARNADAHVEVVDVGTVREFPSTKVPDQRVSYGTTDLRFGPAMSREQAIAAIEIGAGTAERLIAGGSRFLCTGEVGMGNTTAAAAIIAYICDTPAALVTGRGAGIDDATLARKTEIVADAVARLPKELDAIDVVARVGGFEIAAMTGFIVAAAASSIPVLLDGVITQAAALIATMLRAEVGDFLLASHSSAEPGSRVALDRLQLRAILDLDLRLGEGTGAALALPLLRGACATLDEMALITDLLG